MSVSANASATRRRLAIVADDADDLDVVFGSFVRDAVASGNSVLCLAPGLSYGVAREGELNGASLADIPIDPGKPSTYTNRTLKNALSTLLADWRPDVVLVHGPALLAAARAATGRRRDVRLACLLSARYADDLRTRSWLKGWPLARQLRSCDVVLLADHGQAAALRDRFLRQQSTRIVVTPERGVDVARIPADQLPPLDDGLIFLAFDDGGDIEFVDAFQDAAMRIRARSERTRFVVARAAKYRASGQADDGRLVEERTFAPGDELDVIRTAHVVVQGRGKVSYPPSLLLAMAAGRPLIAHDTPAAREAVDEVVNGILVAGTDGEAIANAAEGLLRRPDLIVSMARASRAKAERWFDAAVVNKAIRAELELG